MNLPPGPPTLPIVCHLHLLKELFNQSLFSLSQKHGPIFFLRLGSRLAIVVSSPSAVEKCFTKNDIIFANRPFFWVGKYIGYDYTTLGSSPYCDHRQNLTRICKLEIFSSSRLNSSSSIRRDEIKNFLRKLHFASSDDRFVKVVLKPMVSKLAFNITMRMIAGKRYNGDKIHQMLENFLSFLQWIDFGGHKKRVVKLTREIDGLLQGLIDEHRRNKDVVDKENTMISHLLCLQESQAQYYTDEIIKGIIQVTKICYSEGPQKSKTELDFHVGHGRLLDESDLPKLRYLQNVMSETLRLNPAVPLLIPHVSSDRCNILGYDIPKDTMLLVNAWAIQRDPKVWDEAPRFKPQRFENGRIEGCKMMPFGLGRRSCPGMDLGQRVVGLALGSIIQCFELERVCVKKIDMSEGKGLNLPKTESLEALCKARYTAKKLLSKG
ncbi:cytochrome P450 81D1-like [Hibiscus syriacus]|uniref:Cytochrome P450 81D1-like n=1 Tax=Hibiscus syriacus TaxID=106335 RepID=A0A6A2XDB0_HIBSY|nr:cytochrome P450 81D1-like [Hibiscus syriacus]